jgi:hypothetical protein
MNRIYVPPDNHSPPKAIDYEHYQRYGPENINSYPNPRQVPELEDSINLSEENKNLADYFAKLTLKFFKMSADKNQINKAKTGLNYLI